MAGRREPGARAVRRREGSRRPSARRSGRVRVASLSIWARGRTSPANQRGSSSARRSAAMPASNGSSKGVVSSPASRWRRWATGRAPRRESGCAIRPVARPCRARGGARIARRALTKARAARSARAGRLEREDDQERVALAAVRQLRREEPDGREREPGPEVELQDARVLLLVLVVEEEPAAADEVALDADAEPRRAA